MTYAPIVLFVYKRPEETKKVIDALSANEGAAESCLIVYADGPKNESERAKCEEVRNIIRSTSGFASVTLHESEKNNGLANSVIRGVSETVEKYGKAIVLEDDLVTSRYFLRFMNEALEKYENDDRVCCIHAISYPTKHPEIQTFLRRGADCWGWATWKKGWDLFEKDSQKLYDEIIARKLKKEFDRNNAFPYTRMLKDQADGKIDSWAIRWYASAFLADKYMLQSNVMLIENIGIGKNATHYHSKQKYSIDISQDPVFLSNDCTYETEILSKEHEKYLQTENIRFFKRVCLKLKLILKSSGKQNV